MYETHDTCGSLDVSLVRYFPEMGKLKCWKCQTAILEMEHDGSGNDQQQVLETWHLTFSSCDLLVPEIGPVRRISGIMRVFWAASDGVASSAPLSPNLTEGRGSVRTRISNFHCLLLLCKM